MIRISKSISAEMSNDIWRRAEAYLDYINIEAEIIYKVFNIEFEQGYAAHIIGGTHDDYRAITIWAYRSTDCSKPAITWSYVALNSSAQFSEEDKALRTKTFENEIEAAKMIARLTRYEIVDGLEFNAKDLK